MKHEYLVSSSFTEGKCTIYGGTSYDMIEATGNDKPANSSQCLVADWINGISFTASEKENGLEMSDKD